MKYVKIKPVLIPTNSPTEGVISKGISQMFPQIDSTNPLLTNYHISLTTDEEIKEGDWVHHYKHDMIRKACKKGDVIGWSGGEDTIIEFTPNDKKVVASSDKSLKVIGYNGTKRPQHEVVCHLPSVPKSFIKYFVKNNGRGSEVEIEYCKKDRGHCTINYDRYFYAPKLTDNNEVIIRFKKEIESIDDLMEELHGKLPQRRVYTMERIQEEFGINTGSLKGTISPMEWGMEYSRKDLKTEK